MAKRRGNQEGSIYQLPSGKWRGQVTVQGKRLSKIADTRKEISEWTRSMANQIEQGLTYNASKTTLGDYLARWLISTQNSIRPATYEHYHSLVEKYLTPALGSVLMKDLTADRIQAVYDGWVKDEVGAPTIEKTHAVLHQALERATQTGLLVRNVSDYLSRPKVEREEMKFWTEAEANRFLAAAREDRLYALYHLAITTGARQMELLGLQWSDLDWRTGKLQITHQLARKGEMFAPLKTKAGRRTVILGAATLAALREHYERQQLERQLNLVKWHENELIFTTLIGTPIHHKNMMDRYFKPMVRAAGVPEIRFHDLRHTAVSIMLSHGVSVFVVTKMIGHARPSITSDTYGHLLPGASGDIGQMMDDLVSPVVIPMDVMKG